MTNSTQTTQTTTIEIIEAAMAAPSAPTFKETVKATYNEVANEGLVFADAAINRVLPQLLICTSKTLTLTAQTCALTLEVANSAIEVGINHTKSADSVLSLLGLADEKAQEVADK